MPGFKVLTRCGCVSVIRNPDRVSLYLRYTLAGRTVIETANSPHLKDAKRIAQARSDELKRVADLSKSVERKGVGEAITEAIATFSRAKTVQHKEHLATAGQRFSDWLVRTTRRSTIYWDEIRPSMIRQYIDSMQAEGLAGQTIRHYIVPLTLTAKFMAELDPENYRPLIITHSALAGSKPRKNYLTREQVEDLLQIARGEMEGVDTKKHARKLLAAPQAELATLLCAYAGLRVSEASRLRVLDVNVKLQTVNISDSKNVYSDRVIPVPQWLAKRVAELSSGRNYIFPNADDSGPQSAKECVCKRIKALFKRAGINSVSPRDLRKTFANLAVQAEVGLGELQAYLGHRPASVLETNYADFASVELLRERVVKRVHSESGTGTNLAHPADLAVGS